MNTVIMRAREGEGEERDIEKGESYWDFNIKTGRGGWWSGLVMECLPAMHEPV